jgi:hypothetical protein
MMTLFADQDPQTHKRLCDCCITHVSRSNNSLESVMCSLCFTAAPNGRNVAEGVVHCTSRATPATTV